MKQIMVLTALLGLSRSVVVKTQSNSNESTDSDHKKTVQSMWNDAVTVEQEPAMAGQAPFHFDLVGLAQGLTKTVSVAAHVDKLKGHVAEAEEALHSHEKHVEQIQEMLEKTSDDEEKKKLSKMLKSGKKSVEQLSSTLDDAKDRLSSEIDSVELEDKHKEEDKKKAEQEELLKKQQEEQQTKLLAQQKENAQKLSVVKQKLDQSLTAQKNVKGKLVELKKSASGLEKDMTKKEKRLSQMKHEHSSKKQRHRQEAKIHELKKKLESKKRAISQLKHDFDKRHEQVDHDQQEVDKIEGIDSSLSKKVSKPGEKAASKEDQELKTKESDDTDEQDDDDNKDEETDSKQQRQSTSQVDLKQQLKDKLHNLTSALNQSMEQHGKDETALKDSSKKLMELQMQLAESKKTVESERADKVRLQGELNKTAQSFEKLKQQHDNEAKELFESKETLQFVQQMKHFKSEWTNKTSDEERRLTATNMASTTKLWVSQDETSGSQQSQNQTQPGQKADQSGAEVKAGNATEEEG